MPEVVSKFPFFSRLLKIVVLAAVAGSAVFGNFLMESRAVDGKTSDSGQFSTFDYSVGNEISDYGVIRFADKSVYEGDISMDTVEVGDHEYIFRLNKGKFWGNFLASDAKVNILIGDKLVLIPNMATFDVEFDGSELKIATYSGDVYFGFLENGVKIEKYTDKYSRIFMNRFVVPSDSQATILLSKINQRLKGLLYSRLFTEFKRSSIPEKVKSAKFVKDNLAKDVEYFEHLKQQFSADDKYNGRAVSEGSISSFVFWAEEGLIFVPEKKEDMLFKRLFSYLDQAIFYANKEDPEKVKEFLTKFGEYRSVVPAEVGKSDRYYQELDSYINQLAVFTPADEQRYSIYKHLLDQKFLEGKDVLDVADRLWIGVYRSIDTAPGKIKSSVEDYYDYLKKLIAEDSVIKISDPELYKSFVSYQDQLFENLFLRYSLFYQDVYFAIKDVLEKEILSLHDVGQLRTELSQDFISRKIDFLRKLMSLFFEEDMDVQRTKEITSRLIGEINDLMPPQNAKVAVIALFESQLNNIGDFWGYLNSVEYNSSKAYGATHKDRYKIYLEDRDRIWSFMNVTDAVLSVNGTISAASLNEMKDGIIKFFQANKDVKTINIAEEISDPTQRYAKVGFVLGGYPVDAIFDRYDKTLKNVYVYKQLISSENIKLDNLLALIDKKLSDEFIVEDVDGSNLSTDIANNAQRVAKLYIAGIVKAAGFEITEDQIKLVDEENIVYRVDKVFLKSMPEVTVIFDYLSNKEKVAGLYFIIDGKPIVLDGEYTLNELRDLITSRQFETAGQVKKTSRGE
ncbi:MAG: hypothetical protein WC285_01120 [Candidatus Gracilibacteria bacterium]|jgi:hypothetical protein